MSCRLDRCGWPLRYQSTRELEPRLRNLEPESEACESVDRLLKDVDGVFVASGISDATFRESCRRFYPFPARGTGYRLECPCGNASVSHTLVEKPGLDELLEERSREQVLPSDLVQPSYENRLSCSRLAASHAHRNSSSDHVRVVLEPEQELLRFVETTLEHTNLRETCSRGHAARSLAGVGQFTDGREELLLGGVYPPIRGKDVGAARAAEREQRDVVVSPYELLENLAPLLRPIGVTSPLAREHQCAAHVGECLEARRLAARGGRHRLVEMSEALVDRPERDLGKSELRKRS